MSTTIDLKHKLAEIERMNADTRKLMNESTLFEKKAKWYELVIFGGAGIAIGLALAKIFS